MNFKVFILRKVVKWLLGGKLFGYIQHSVMTMEDTNLSGEEKRRRVLQDVKKAFGDVSTFLVNLGIEVAVTYLKAQEGKLEKVK